MIRELLSDSTVLTGATGAVIFGMLAYMIIPGILRRKELKDAWNESDDPNVPDLRKYWCRKCRGHHRTYNRGSGDSTTTMCKNCDSDDLHRVTPITLWQKFGYSLFILVPLSLGIVAETLGVNTSPIQIAYVFYGMAVLCAFGFGYVYRTKSAVRNEWLIWAKERGYEENAEKI
jgi:hypothetical protein